MYQLSINSKTHLCGGNFFGGKKGDGLLLFMISFSMACFCSSMVFCCRMMAACRGSTAAFTFLSTTSPIIFSMVASCVMRRLFSLARASTSAKRLSMPWSSYKRFTTFIQCKLMGYKCKNTLNDLSCVRKTVFFNYLVLGKMFFLNYLLLKKFFF